MNRQGFTLTELVSVCAVISLLMAVIAPALNASRHKARAVVCSSNIRQIGIAITVYSSINGMVPRGFADSSIAPQGGFPGGLAYDKMGWWWFNYIGQFYDNPADRETILQCPSKNLQEPRLKTNILCGNYGINELFCKSTSSRSNYGEFVGQPLKLTGISRPSQVLLIADSGYALINWWHATLDPPVTLNPIFIENTSYVPGMEINSQKTIWPGQENDAIGGRHPNRTVNVGFADGHVENIKADKLLVEKVQDGYKNCSPLWSPR